MQIPAILESLNAIASANPMSSALGAAGFSMGSDTVGGLHQGTDASRDVDRPFGLLNASVIGRTHGSSAYVKLIEYAVELQIIEDEGVGTTAAILEVFHQTWDRLTHQHFSALNPDLAEFVYMDANDDAEIGEADQQDLGKDIILGVTSWTLGLEEKQPTLE